MKKYITAPRSANRAICSKVIRPPKIHFENLREVFRPGKARGNKGRVKRYKKTPGGGGFICRKASCS